MEVHSVCWCWQSICGRNLGLSSECGVKVLVDKALAAPLEGEILAHTLPFHREIGFTARLSSVLGLVQVKLNLTSWCFLEQSKFMFLRFCLLLLVYCFHLYCGGGHRCGN